ncbi:hypothetical protein D3C84_974290 [compost metagenome]
MNGCAIEDFRKPIATKHHDPVFHFNYGAEWRCACGNDLGFRIEADVADLLEFFDRILSLAYRFIIGHSNTASGETVHFLAAAPHDVVRTSRVATENL